MHEFLKTLSKGNIHTSAYPNASRYCRLPVQIRGEFQLQNFYLYYWNVWGTAIFSNKTYQTCTNFIHSVFDVHYTVSLIKQIRKNMGSPCKKNPIYLHCHFCHQSMHQVLHSTLKATDWQTSTSSTIISLIMAYNRYGLVWSEHLTV